MIRWFTIGAAIAVLLTAACGPLQSENVGRAAVSGILSTARGGAAAATPPLSRATIEAASGPLIYAAVLQRGTSATLSLAGTNSGKDTWIAVDGISLTVQDGLLIATRGLGDDLMAADVAKLRQGFQDGRQTRRVHDYLTGQDEIRRQTYDCTMAAKGSTDIVIFERRQSVTLYEETCTGSASVFLNRYWRDGSGVIWKSQQFVSPGVGHIEIQRL